MNKIINGAALLILIAFSSCKKEDYNLWTGRPMIQFGPDTVKVFNTDNSLADTSKTFTFIYDLPTTMQDTAWFDVYALGGPTNADRPFVLQQIQDSTGAVNATPGVDYKAFTDATVAGAYVIKAGQVHTKIPIVMLKSPALATTNVSLIFVLMANDNFQLGEPTKLWRKLIFNNQLIKPTNWTSTMNSLYGTYSKVKHQFMINVTGQPWNTAFIASLFSGPMSAVYFYSGQLKAALANYNNANPGNPMKDENGALVVFP